MAAPPLREDHINTLTNLADALQNTAEPWWLYGSTALALSGVDPGRIQDIDVLISPVDSETMMRLHGWPNLADGGNTVFRSKYLLRPALGEIPVELFSGFEIKRSDTWQTVTFQTRLSVEINGRHVFVPDLSEQRDLLKAMGRPKDLERLIQIDKFFDRS